MDGRVPTSQSESVSSETTGIRRRHATILACGPCNTKPNFRAAQSWPEAPWNGQTKNLDLPFILRSRILPTLPKPRHPVRSCLSSLPRNVCWLRLFFQALFIKKQKRPYFLFSSEFLSRAFRFICPAASQNATVSINFNDTTATPGCAVHMLGTWRSTCPVFGSCEQT